MAELVTEALGEALLQLVHEASLRAQLRARQAAEWLRENARPPDGARLEADGTYSGIALVHRNQVIALVAARHEGEAPKPMITPRNYDTPPPRDPFPEPEEPAYRDGYRDWGWGR